MICPHCQRTIEDRDRPLMAIDPDKPGLSGLLRGEGEEPLLNLVAWGGALWVVFLVALACFWVLGQALP